MYKVGEYLVYGGYGVMTVVDIREETFGRDTRSYYVLREVGSHADSLTYVPADNETLTAQMRPLLTKEEILDVFRVAKELPDCEWAKDSRGRTEIFRRITESGDRARIIAMIRTIFNAGLRREAEGKKNFISDENAKQKAEKLIHSEFSIVLGIPEEDIPGFIEEEMNK